jgi:hypothetical protein
VLFPYSTYQVVASPFGLTMPPTVADVGPYAVTAPVVATGCKAAAAPAVARQPISTARAPATLRFATRRSYPGGVRTLLGNRKRFARVLGPRGQRRTWTTL